MDTTTIVRIGLIALVLIAVMTAMLSLPRSRRSRDRSAARAYRRQSVHSSAGGHSSSNYGHPYVAYDSGGGWGGGSCDFGGGGSSGGDGGGGGC